MDWAFARYQEPSPLPAVLLASRERTPSSTSASRLRRAVFHCRHIAALSRNRTQRVSANNTSGVSQNPRKYPEASARDTEEGKDENQLLTYIVLSQHREY
jgi:hypothetical protein